MKEENFIQHIQTEKKKLSSPLHKSAEQETLYVARIWATKKVVSIICNIVIYKIPYKSAKGITRIK